MTVKTDVVAEYTSGSGVTIDGVLLKDGLVDGVDVGAPFAGILATGATVGATSQAQAFTLGVVSPFIAPAADGTAAWQVRKADGTTPIVTVDTTNSNVGIGTTSPGAKLDVNGGIDLAYNSPLRFYQGSNNYRVVLKSDYKFEFYTYGDTGVPNRGWHFIDSNSGVERVTMSAGTGNVGIGTTAPATALHVVGALRLQGDPAWNPWDIESSYVLTNSDLMFKHNGSLKLLINNAGDVGIGTTAPATALHVVGAATVTGGIRPAADSTTALQLQNVAGTSVLNVDTTNARVGIGTTSPGAKLDVNGTFVITGGNVPIATPSLQLFYSTGLESSFIQSIASGVAWKPLFIDASVIALGLTNGNVGIGDTAPAEALDVTGNINTTGVVKVDDVQVLSNRVIDARCADVANSGDATTDGLIDALRDAMIAHGLIAASA